MPDESVVYDLDERGKVTVAEGARVWRVTAALRFIERQVRWDRTSRHLQQFYVASDGATEWRDVPMVRENG